MMTLKPFGTRPALQLKQPGATETQPNKDTTPSFHTNPRPALNQTIQQLNQWLAPNPTSLNASVPPTGGLPF